MLAEKRNSLLVLLLILAIPAVGQNFSISATILETTLAEITDFSVVTGNVVDFLFTIKNTGNTNTSAFPEITVYDSNNNTVVTLYGDPVNITRGSTKDLTFSWSTTKTGSFIAKLIVFYDDNTKSTIASKTFVLQPILPGATVVGGGGSGAGVKTEEPYYNVEIWEIREKYLHADIPTSYIFTTRELAIYEVLITPAKNFGTISIKVEQLKGLSKIEGVMPPACIVYEYLNIWVGDGEVVRNAGIKDASVRFKVEKNWLSENKLDDSNIMLIRWDGSSWISLETELKNRDENFVYYLAKTSAFTPFAICAGPGHPFPTPQITETPTPIESPTQKIEESKFSLWGYLLTALISIGILSYSLIYIRKKSKENDSRKDKDMSNRNRRKIS